MRVLFVGFVWPEPKSSAAGQNILSYIETFIHNGDEVSFCSAADTTEQSENLAQLGVNTFVAQLNNSSFNQQVADLAPHIVIFDRFLCFEQFAWRIKQTCPKAMLVLDAEDLHFLRKARHEMQKGSNELFMSSNEISTMSNRATLLNDVALRELACIYQADLTLALSSFECELLTHVFNVPEYQLAHTPFILSSDNAPSSKLKPFEARQDFVLIGNFRHAPNYHSAKVLRENLWPSIAKRLKTQGVEAKCHVYGAYLSPKAKQLENKSLGFLVHGFAPNQFDVIENARVMLAPITFGAGVKGKLLDAMQCKTPSITSPIGAEGISQLAWPGAIVSDAEMFVTQAINMYTQHELWHLQVDRAKHILEQDYDMQKNRLHLVNTIRRAWDSLSHNRSINILQQVLSHHQFQTSRYMSQWIEAKNKHK